MAPPGLLEIGVVVRPHALRGEVVVALVTNRVERLAPGTRLAARRRGGEDETLEVRASRPFQHRFIVSFAGVESREAAEDLRGTVLLAEPVEDPDAYYVHELIGAAVVEVDGTARGTITAVEANPASDLLVLDHGRALVPLRFVVGRAPGRVIVEVPAGLFE